MELPMTCFVVLNLRDKGQVAALTVRPWLNGETSIKARKVSASLCTPRPIMLPHLLLVPLVAVAEIIRPCLSPVD